MVHLQDNFQHFGAGNCSKLLTPCSVATDHVPTDTPAANLLWNAVAISQESLLLNFLGNSGEQANRAEPFAPQKDMSLESADPLIAQSSPTASHTPAPRRTQAVQEATARRAVRHRQGTESRGSRRRSGNFGKPTGEIGTVELTNVGV